MRVARARLVLYDDRMQDLLANVPGLRARRAEIADLPDAEVLRMSVIEANEWPAHRSRELRAQSSAAQMARDRVPWLRGALAAFGIGRAYHLAVGPDGSPWWRIEPSSPLHWLERVVALPRPSVGPSFRSRWGDGHEDLVIVSEDLERTLIVETREDSLWTHSFPTRELAARTSGLSRIRRAVEAVPGMRALSRGAPWYASAILAESTPSEAPVATWSWPDAGGLSEGLAALVSPPQEPTHRPPYCYQVSTGTFGALAWRSVVPPPRASWLEELWAADAWETLFIAADPPGLVLALRRDGSRIDASLERIDAIRCR